MSNPCEQKDRLKDIEKDVTILKEKIGMLDVRTSIEIGHLTEMIRSLNLNQNKFTWWMISTFATSLVTLLGIAITVIMKLI